MSKTVSLDTLSPGENARVIALRGGREFQHRIQSMGVSMGSELSVIQNNGDGEHGGIVIRAGDTRLMIGHGMASKVIVRPV